MKATKPRLLPLFLSVLKISAFTFGGGYVIVPLMRKRFSE
ncbi:MAG: chromate transporter, partial [Clostridiales bacterium]|nr:chromate transporter [Clostridiales bacterium]